MQDTNPAIIQGTVRHSSKDAIYESRTETVNSLSASERPPLLVRSRWTVESNPHPIPFIQLFLDTLLAIVVGKGNGQIVVFGSIDNKGVKLSVGNGT